MRRIINVVVAGAGLLVMAPIMIVMILIARFDTKASGIFAQRRVGRHRKLFTCFKLRTMRREAPEASGSHLVSSAFITPFGGFLRKSKLDEIPQLWNVLRGDMDIIGPRPCLEGQAELIAERDKRGVFAVRPGITGLAQVRGVDMSNPLKLAIFDAKYIKQRSVLTDLYVLGMTFSGRGSGDRVGN